MKQVDVGGPTMLRAAAKNHADVIVVVDPADYDAVLDAVRAGEVPLDTRRTLARKVFAHTGRYDTAIADYFGAETAGAESPGAKEMLPPSVVLELRQVQPLRYGENPDQSAAFYAERGAPPGTLPDMRQMHGKELSFNNLLDVDAAVSAISAWAGEETAASIIIKHTTPCGAAIGATLVEAYQRALAGDPVSAFGGIVALNATVDERTAEELSSTFLEIIVAPGFSAAALDILTRKKNLRLIELPITPAAAGERDYKRVRGGFLMQDRMSMRFDESAWRIVSKRQPDEREHSNLRFAWRVCASVKSNAIVLARDGRTIGIGAGQMSRVDSSRVAVMKARDHNADITGAALASDAFFPFRDGIDAAAAAGVSAVIQPGGSVRDDEVISAADEHGMAMIFTSRRVFRH
jgi:phosphoribosylaminoimidazolecarboxamide formyltransferase / IMP cyclohydrolase